ncbi:lipoprotein, putative [[Synechococcus] sp. NIES-970]|nr:lipoprotein, putative [[Synechococcus] sp. NIES-970]
MAKVRGILCLVAVVVSLTACGLSQGSNSQSPSTEETVNPNASGSPSTRAGTGETRETPEQNAAGNGGGAIQTAPENPQAIAQAPPPTSPPPQPTTSTSLETRCGWFSNPTPGNISLYDADREWIIGVQGGHQVAADWDWPNFAPDQWVVTNAGSYGYGCACMDVRANPSTGTIAEIRNVRAQAIAICQQDPALNRWANLFP